MIRRFPPILFVAILCSAIGLPKKMPTGLYEILEVPRGASQKELLAAYQRTIPQSVTLPVAGSDPLTVPLTRLVPNNYALAAYQILSHEPTRKLYNEFLDFRKTKKGGVTEEGDGIFELEVFYAVRGTLLKYPNRAERMESELLMLMFLREKLGYQLHQAKSQIRKFEGKSNGFEVQLALAEIEINKLNSRLLNQEITLKEYTTRLDKMNKLLEKANAKMQDKNAAMAALTMEKIELEKEVRDLKGANERLAAIADTAPGLCGKTKLIVAGIAVGSIGGTSAGVYFAEDIRDFIKNATDGEVRRKPK